MFNQDKTTQLVALFLWKSGGRFIMPYLKMIKLMYFVEKEGLLRYGYSITGDKPVSMPNGPVLSGTYNLICNGDFYESWKKLIKGEADYCISLNSNGITDENYKDKFDLLNEVEFQLVDEIYEKYKEFDRWEIRNLTHNSKVCPEWKDPNGSSYPISLEDMFIKNGKTKEDIEIAKNRIKADNDYEFLMQGLF